MNDIALELARLHVLKGADFVRQLKMLVLSGIFKPVENERDIFAADANHHEDFPSLLDAARKAVAHGNKVYILPNPNGIRTADFIFENKGIYKMYDLKTITGQSSIENRLLESIGQTYHVLLNICTTYNSRLMAIQIRNYFNVYPDALEVLVYKGKKTISVTRRFVENPLYLIQFTKKYEQSKKPLLSGSFDFGAGSIRAYPHAENTGLVISDIAKVQQNSFPAMVLWKIFIITSL